MHVCHFEQGELEVTQFTRYFYGRVCSFVSGTNERKNKLKCAETKRANKKASKEVSSEEAE